MIFHFGWKSHFGIQSALYLRLNELRQNETQTGMDFIFVILTDMECQSDMKFPREQNFPEAERVTPV